MRAKRIIAGIMIGVLLSGQIVCAQNEISEEQNVLESEHICENQEHFGCMQEPSLIELPSSELPNEETGEVELQSEQYNEAELFFLLEQKVKEALLEEKTELDIRDMRIRTNPYQIPYLTNFSPYFSNGIHLVFYYSGDYYVKIELSNEMSLTETEEYFYNVDRKVEQILALVTDGMTEETKALIIHDYFVNQCEYDADNYNNGTIPRDSYRSGSVIMKEISVCQGYAYAYKYIMNRIGMECHVVSSSTINHGWNIIKIDGRYYQVDCTWDDPVSDRFGMVGHNNFLLSDEGIEASGHYNWTLQSILGDIACNSKKYDNAYWIEVVSPIVLVGEYSYYEKGRDIYKRNVTTQEETVVRNLGWWPVWDTPGYSYTTGYSGLFQYAGYLYYNTATEIRKLSLSTGEDSLVYAPNTSAGYVYGIRNHNGVLQYSIAKKPGEREAVFDAPVDIRTYPEGISIENNIIKMEVNDTAYLLYSFTPKQATAQISWQSDNTAVVTVNKSGKVTARSPGNATITAMTDNGKIAFVYVTVYPPLSFSDVEQSHWFYDSVVWAYRNQIMTGLNQTTFGPNQPLARAQFSLILYRMNGEPSVEYTEKFPDIQAGVWYTNAVLWASGMGIVTGYSDTGRFGPGDNINREQMAVMLYRYAVRKGYDVSKKEDISKFTDSDRVNEFAKEAMQWAVGTGIITGKDNGTRLDPQGNASRAECATIMQRWKKING